MSSALAALTGYDLTEKQLVRLVEDGPETLLASLDGLIPQPIRTDATLRGLKDPVRMNAPALWVRGHFPVDQHRVAIVGSRTASAQSLTAVRRLAFEAVGRGESVVSGLAYGVDIEAHRATLDAGGHTIAVLPCGIDRVHPHEHARDVERILDSGGCVVSAYAPGRTVSSRRLLARNQTIMALADRAVIAHMTSMRSGTSAAVNRARKIGTPLSAVPGSPGTDTLIANGTPVT